MLLDLPVETIFKSWENGDEWGKGFAQNPDRVGG